MRFYRDSIGGAYRRRIADKQESQKGIRVAARALYSAWRSAYGFPWGYDRKRLARFIRIIEFIEIDIWRQNAKRFKFRRYSSGERLRQ